LAPRRLIERVPLTVRIVVHVGALLAAVVVPVVLLTLPAGFTKFAPFFFGPSLGFAIVFGMPMYFALHRMERINVFTAALAGFAAIALPLGYMAWPSAPGSVSIDDVPTVVNGVVTRAGWTLFVSFLFNYSILGAIGGVVFWAVLKLAGELPGQHPRAAARVAGAVALSFLAVSAAAAIWYLPTYTADRSCHAKYPYGRGIGIELDIPHDEWDALRELLHNYADARQLSFRDLSEERPGVRILSVDVCDDTTRIHANVNEIRWERDGFKSPSGRDGIAVLFFNSPADAAWRTLARELVDEIHARWPNNVKVSDELTEYVATPPEPAD